MEQKEANMIGKAIVEEKQKAAAEELKGCLIFILILLGLGVLSLFYTFSKIFEMQGF